MKNISENNGRQAGFWVGHDLGSPTISRKKSEGNTHAVTMARWILSEVMAYRRVAQKSDTNCLPETCGKCADPHFLKILKAVTDNKVITFILPAFPGKSPNPNKVLGVLPDKAEILALDFLQSLCVRISKKYKPGVKIILCSDGRVFSDVIGIKEKSISNYQSEIKTIIKQRGLNCLSTFNLDDVYRRLNFKQMRDELMKAYGTSQEVLQFNIRNGKTSAGSLEQQEAHGMYCGMTRFLFEDSLLPGQVKSRTLLQKEARAKAYHVIQRSNAWSDLIAERFPEAVRLSIHPQGCGSAKLGIRLIGSESWMTPWHGVAVEAPQGTILLKRQEAESMGATLEYFNDGRPSHFVLKGIKALELTGASK